MYTYNSNLFATIDAANAYANKHFPMHQDKPQMVDFANIEDLVRFMVMDGCKLRAYHPLKWGSNFERDSSRSCVTFEWRGKFLSYGVDGSIAYVWNTEDGVPEILRKLVIGIKY